MLKGEKFPLSCFLWQELGAAVQLMKLLNNPSLTSPGVPWLFKPFCLFLSCLQSQRVL